MKCPFCGFNEDKVVDSREVKDGTVVRRRRECQKCGRRFTTYEKVEKIPIVVVKKDGRREIFNRQKLLSGIMKACEKRPIPYAKIEQIVDRIEFFLNNEGKTEFSSKKIGEMVMNELKKMDKVAYIRFASVYREFKDVGEFFNELKKISDTDESKDGRKRE